MIPPNNELRVWQDVWQSDSGGGRSSPADLLCKLERRASEFRRRIWRRNLRESIAGLVVFLFFGFLATRQPNLLARAALAWLAVSGLWVAFYVHRYSKTARAPAPDQTLACFRRSLLAAYDEQIRLLRAAKYWYILPFWLGLLLIALASWKAGMGPVRVGLFLLWITAVNAVVWWMNEVPGVRSIRGKRDELLTLVGEDA